MDSVTVGAASTPSEDEALAALTAEAEKAPTTTEEAIAARDSAQEPTKLAGKFNSTEDLLKAYQELERKLGAGETEETPAAEELPVEGEEETPAEEEELPEDQEVTEDDVEELSATEVVEYLTDRFAEQEGQLSDEDYSMAEEMGYDRDMVDAYIRGQQAQSELATLKLHDAAGGEDNLNAMLVWASTGLDAKSIDEYNAALADNDVTKATAGVSKLRAQYEAANGVEPKLLGGKPARVSNDVFTSWAEVTAAMSDKRYGTKDAKYTAEVAAKLSRSSI
jgi:hypothetical protein